MNPKQSVQEAHSDYLLKQAKAPDVEAFSRLELLATLAALALVVLVALPALANNRERSLRLQCVSNLQLVGEGLQEWGTDHGGNAPWRTPWCEGGLMASGRCSNSANPFFSASMLRDPWVQYYWLSNELRTPRILACPSDSKKIPAATWGAESNGGFLNVSYRDNAVSYIIGLDVFPEDGLGLLSGDRNLRFQGRASGCSTGLESVFAIYFPFQASITNGVHNEAGNFLFSDGSVEQLSDAALKKRMKLVNQGGGDNSSIHFLTP